MKYGFFGGAFNPPTTAHFELAKKVKNTFKLDKIFFVPVGNFYEKNELIDEKHRYNMLKILCEKCTYLEVSNIEMNCKSNLKAIDVFKLIYDKYKSQIENNGLEVYFIIGSDNLEKMINWKSADELISKYKYIVLERDRTCVNEILEGSELFKKNSDNFKVLKNDFHNNISSTEARSLVKNSEINKVCEIIPEEIYEYIVKNKLYI